MCYTGHALCHTGLFNFGAEQLIGVLKATVTMKQGMCPWIGFKSFVKGLEYQLVIVAITNNIGHRPAITEVKDGTQIYLFYGSVFRKVLEFGHIRNPFLVVFICMEVPVEYILCCIVWINSRPGATVVTSFYYGAQSLLAAYAQDTLVISMQAMVMLNLISNPSVAHIWMLLMD